MRAWSLFLFVGSLLVGCHSPARQEMRPQSGRWVMRLDIGERRIPFQFDFLADDGAGPLIRIHNASEVIDVNEISFHGDSILIRMPLFDSEFAGALVTDTLFKGYWYNRLKGPEYRIPFVASRSDEKRFPNQASASSVSGPWRTTFSDGDPEAYQAIGLFEQMPDGVVRGTFMTETGDYRFLEGARTEDSLLLSSFDGSHAFLFAASVRKDSMSGRFWSGTHWQEPWEAVRDETYALRDPDSLTALRKGTERVEFSFPDLDGNPWSTHDSDVAGHPMIVHVMGSWCPNCIDETRLLKEVYERYSDRGLRIVAIGFEKYQETHRAIQALRRFKERLDVPYPVLHGGSASKEQASMKLPFLNHIISYPTCIFMDRNGHVRRIRTGFNGPGTGVHYAAYKEDLFGFLDSLVSP